MKPTRHILSKAFQYVKSDETDIRRTFERVRLQIAASQEHPKATRVNEVAEADMGENTWTMEGQRSPSEAIKEPDIASSSPALSATSVKEHSDFSPAVAAPIAAPQISPKTQAEGPPWPSAVGASCIEGSNIVNTRCDAPSWWDCKTRGCRKEALKAYGEQVSRFEPRDEHDQDTQGRKLKAGR